MTHNFRILALRLEQWIPPLAAVSLMVSEGCKEGDSNTFSLLGHKPGLVGDTGRREQALLAWDG